RRCTEADEGHRRPESRRLGAVLMMRTHRCGELRATDAGARVTLCGWVHHRRDHGKVVFLDLRDAGGVVQVVFPPDKAALAGDIQREWCVRLDGTVVARKAGTE